MAKLSIGSVTIDDLALLAELASPGITQEPWDSAVDGPR